MRKKARGHHSRCTWKGDAAWERHGAVPGVSTEQMLHMSPSPTCHFIHLSL